MVVQPNVLKQLCDMLTLSCWCRSGKVVYKKTDVTDWKQLSELVDYAKSALGGVDLMCNGAGIFEPVRLLVPPCLRKGQSP